MPRQSRPFSIPCGSTCYTKSMAGPENSIERVRAAKAGVRKNLGKDVDVVGVGVTKTRSGYALKVNVGRAPKGGLPSEIDGVPVVFEVVGAIRPK